MAILSSSVKATDLCPELCEVAALWSLANSSKPRLITHVCPLCALKAASNAVCGLPFAAGSRGRWPHEERRANLVASFSFELRLADSNQCQPRALTPGESGSLGWQFFRLCRQNLVGNRPVPRALRSSSCT
ncbi:unnamed protein product [Effrenium voratum]|uniref:Uncharacterized protein n=1 Tax=Effrenium voratum TaxID=2562239 RepID=A0AA36JQ60_9DINO|nr:unnamed protein product [Effrenium voratum]